MGFFLKNYEEKKIVEKCFLYWFFKLIVELFKLNFVLCYMNDFKVF